MICPRFSIHKDITLPTKSDFVIMVAFIYGSSIRLSLEGSGKSLGLFTKRTVSGSLLVYAL